MPVVEHTGQNKPTLLEAVLRGQGQEYGLETLVANTQTQSRVEHIVQHLEQVALESIESATTDPHATPSKYSEPLDSIDEMPSSPRI